MRNGDSYKIKHMANSGVPTAEICHAFRNKYDAAEVKRFIPVTAATLSDSDSPKPKRKARKRSTAKG